ncbi:MAG: hypothetical protein ACK2T6_03920 [Anaerolineae bacterium]
MVKRTALLVSVAVTLSVLVGACSATDSLAPAGNATGEGAALEATLAEPEAGVAGSETPIGGDASVDTPVSAVQNATSVAVDGVGTVTPGVNVPRERGSWDLDPAAVRIDTQGLSYDWEAMLVPATPIEAAGGRDAEGQAAESGVGPSGLPEHVELRFSADDGETAVLYIIPVAEYLDMWGGESSGVELGGASLEARMESIMEIVHQLPSPPLPSDMPALPLEETPGRNDLAVRAGRPTPVEGSAILDGYRFIGRFGDGASPVTNDDLRYIYQGFTNDGDYLVAAFFPIRAPGLPEDESAVSDDERAAYDADPVAQVAEIAEELATLPAGDWEPSRDALDDLVGSLRIEGGEDMGLAGTTWEWTGVTFLDDSKPVEDPETHVVTFGVDGSVQLVSDCRRRTFPYSSSGGVVGTLKVEPISGDEEPCDPEERVDEFELGVIIADTYRLGVGGEVLGLQLPGQGPIHWFRRAD